MLKSPVEKMGIRQEQMGNFNREKRTRKVK